MKSIWSGKYLNLWQKLPIQTDTLRILKVHTTFCPPSRAEKKFLVYGPKIFTDRNIETDDLMKYYHLYYYFKLVIKFNNLDGKYFLINKHKSEKSEESRLCHKKAGYIIRKQAIS